MTRNHSAEASSRWLAIRDVAVLWLGLQCIVFAGAIPTLWLVPPGVVLLGIGMALVRFEMPSRHERTPQRDS